MTEKRNRHRPLNWLLPLAFALPVLAVIGYAYIKYGTTAENALNILMKMAVIP